MQFRRQPWSGGPMRFAVIRGRFFTASPLSAWPRGIVAATPRPSGPRPLPTEHKNGESDGRQAGRGDEAESLGPVYVRSVSKTAEPSRSSAMRYNEVPTSTRNPSAGDSHDGRTEVRNPFCCDVALRSKDDRTGLRQAEPGASCCGCERD